MKKTLRILLFFTLALCSTGVIFLPLLVQAQNEPFPSYFNTNLLNDLTERSIYFFKKGVLDDAGDSHYYRIPLREGKNYSVKLWITAPEGGTFVLALFGDLTFGQDLISTSDNLVNELLEFEYKSDATITGEIRIIYSVSGSTQKPTYSLYANRVGFAGLWWIVLSGVGILAVLVVLFTFAIIGMISVAKKRRK